MQLLSTRQGRTLSAIALLSSFSLHAQDSTPVYDLRDFTVSTGPVARDVSEFASPLSILDESSIRRNGGSSLGELLEGQPGVSATSFGAGASRPIIRGFDGPRVRILESGIEAADVSETSPDHAVATEPMLLERVEIIRGPATLLYGSSAIGGVVNTVGKEIPRERVDPKGYEGALESRYDTASRGETFLGTGKVGGENWAVSVTGLSRTSEDYDIPERADITNPLEPGELDNSFVDTDSGSIGGSWFFGEQSYFGAAFSRYETLYGVPGPEPVVIDLGRNRVHSEFVTYEPIDWIEAARARLAYTDYRHTEIEGGAPEAVFSREGWELRVDASHRDWALADEGVFGFQMTDADVSVISDHPFITPSETRSQSVFISEHIHGDALHYEYGARVENQDIDADGIANGYSDLAVSLAAGVIWNLDANQSIALNLQRSQRHPTATELYAGGPHQATEQYEIGDPNLELETAYGVDLSYEFDSENWEATFNLFYTRFDDYIFARNLGFQTDNDGLVAGDPGFDPTEAKDTYLYTAVDADFWGFEAEIERVLYSSTATTWTLGLLADYVRAENRDANNPLPRIPPLRVGLQSRVESGPWTGKVLLRRALNQDRVTTFETETDGYTELNLNIERTFDIGNGTQFTAFARASNLLDEDIRHHTSFLKDFAPQPGRSLSIGGRVEF